VQELIRAWGAVEDVPLEGEAKLTVDDGEVSDRPTFAVDGQAAAVGVLELQLRQYAFAKPQPE
jgi:hypothetical protein